MEKLIWEGRASWSSIISFWNIILALITMGYWLIIPILMIFNTKYRITNQRLIVTKGIISRNMTQMDWIWLKDLHMHQGMFGRIFNYGDVIITSNDITIPVQRLHKIANPIQIMEQIRSIAGRNEDYLYQERMPIIPIDSNAIPNMEKNIFDKPTNKNGLDMIKEIFPIVVGILMICFGILIIIGVIASENTKFFSMKELFIFFTLGVLPVLSGGWFCFLAIKLRKKRKFKQLINNVLRIASEMEGSLTVVELVMKTSLSVDQAKEILDHFIREQIAFIKISGNGTIIYEFVGMISQKEKKEAESLQKLIYKE